MFPGAFYHLLASRASLADELAKKIEEQRVREEELKAELLQVAPKNMIAFIENELGLDSLFKYGMFLGKIRFHDEMCGFRDMEDTKKKVQGLQKADRKSVV